MKSEELTMVDVLIETHIGLERQGPGSAEMTVKALGFLGALDDITQVADLGCGTGGQTMLLAQHIKGTIIGVDLFPDFVDAFNANARELNVQDRVQGVTGSMDDLSFERESFDLMWSEGAIDSIGFEKGLSYWHGFLKKGGYVAVTCPSWFTGEHPAEIEDFWAEAGSKLDTVEHNISILQKAGYCFVAAFALPEECWTDQYFAPREAAEAALLEKYAGSAVVEESIAQSKREEELYAQYKQHYGYAFYIGKKL